MKHSHYHKDVSNLHTIDVYDVLRLFEVESHPVGHAIKKLLMAGKRGVKGYAKDLQEAIDSVERELSVIEPAVRFSIDRPEQCRCTLSPKPETDGWILWGGGDIPVNGSAKVEVKLRSGCVLGSRQAIDAVALGWCHAGSDSDIIAYREVNPKEHPWYPDDSGEWIEVVGGVQPTFRVMRDIEFLSTAERNAKFYSHAVYSRRDLSNLNWRDIVAYKPIKQEHITNENNATTKP